MLCTLVVSDSSRSAFSFFLFMCTKLERCSQNKGNQKSTTYVNINTVCISAINLEAASARFLQLTLRSTFALLQVSDIHFEVSDLNINTLLTKTRFIYMLDTV